jgi:hypothetical protein
VAFAKRFRSDGQEAPLDPTHDLDASLAAGVVADKRLVERIEPAAQHSQEALDEDDAFLASAAPEVWDYDVVNSRKDEFENAVRSSANILEFEVLDESEIEPADATGAVLRNSRLPEDTPADSTRRAAEGLAEPAGAGLDGLQIKNAGDPSLGLTAPGDPAADWAANTGPDGVPRGGIATRDLTDKSSTLRQPSSTETPEPSAGSDGVYPKRPQRAATHRAGRKKRSG